MEKLIEEIKTVAKELVKLGWAPANAGNFSILLDMPPAGYSNNFGIPLNLDGSYPNLGGNYILTKISGSTMEELWESPEQYSCVVRIDKENTATMWQLKPSAYMNIKLTSEYKIHLGILNLSLKENKSYRAVLHTHPDNLSSVLYYLTHREKERFLELLYKQQPAVAAFLAQEVGIIPYVPPGSIELANKILKEVERNHSLVIMEQHGCVATNRTLLKALEVIKLVFCEPLFYRQLKSI
ncbi:MAG: class II aldolase/adducin family protein [Ignavibacteria bacterium]